MDALETLWVRVLEKAQSRNRLIVSIAGAPGSGKSTLAEQLLERLNTNPSAPVAALVPMDGFHLDNETLEQCGLLHRKGAPQTFDTEGFRETLARIRVGGADISVPAFDRNLDSVIPDAKNIDREIRIVIVEGNYLLLNQVPWCSLAPLFDLTVFLHVDPEVLKSRLVKRWLDQGYNLEDAKARALSNDVPNARLVEEQSVPAEMVFKTSVRHENEV
jgi:pantothenate kinase